MPSSSAATYFVPDGRCVILRRAEHADHEAVTTLLRSLELPTDGVADWLDRYRVADYQRQVVGVAGMEQYGDAGLLRSVAVASGWQGSGIGRALIDQVLEDGRTTGVREVYLLTTTAEHYFPRLGFACITREEVPAQVQSSVEFTSACPSSAVVMRRKLADAQMKD